MKTPLSLENTGWEERLANLLDPPFDPDAWRAQPKQALAEKMAHQVDEMLYGGAAGGGKTEWGLEHVIGEMERYPGNRGIIFRREFPRLERTVIPRAKIKLYDRAHWNGANHTFTFPNGSVLELAHLQRADSILNYQGAEYGVAFFEEITEFLQSQYEFIIGRLRAPVPGVKPHAVATTNPGGPGHRWVKRRWISPKPEDMEPGHTSPRPLDIWRPVATLERPEPLTRCFVPATLEDNPKLTERDPGYVQRLRQNSNRALRKALEEGDWEAIDAVEGALWLPEWLDDGRVLEIRTPVIRRVVAVDPSDGSEAKDADEFGVSVCCRGADGVGYVEMSDGWIDTPRAMAANALQLGRDLGASAIVVEKNHGGAWLVEVFRSVDPTANIITVHASQGKIARAEPVAALFEPIEGLGTRARMVGYQPELEEECTHYTGETGQVSPNRMDAMVWGLTELMLGRPMAVRRDKAPGPDARLRGRR